MLVLSFLLCDLYDNCLFLVQWYPVGFWYTNQGLGAPTQAVPLILSKGLTRLPGLAKASYQMLEGILPLVERI